MNWITLLIKLIPTIIQLITFAEKAFADTPGTGAQKKELVTGAAKAIVGGVVAVSTGGQAETWDRIAEPVGTIIDSTAGILFPHDEEDDV